VRVSVINGPDIKSGNTVEKPDQVGIKNNVLNITGKSFTFTFEPHSVTAMICAVS
jgi:alpha-L-arabinofuranosidase